MQDLPRTQHEWIELRNKIKAIIDEELVLCLSNSGVLYADDACLYTAADSVVALLQGRRDT